MTIFPGVERRHYFRAYAFGLVCSVGIRQMQYDVNLIDICPGGTRLRFPESGVPDIKQFDVLSLTCSVPSLSGLLDGISAEVRWVTQREIGVRFLEELPMTTPDIQRLIG